MKRQRLYRKSEDLAEIGSLIRRVYAKVPYWNAWGFARFDIWAQRRIGDEKVRGKRDWQQDICLWETEHGELVGAVLSEGDGDAAALISDPEQSELAEAMLTWTEARWAEKGGPRSVIVEIMDSNAFLEHLLDARGYVKRADHMIHREKTLEDGQVMTVALPPGFVLKPIETLEEMRRFHLAVKSVFNFQDSVEVYRIVQQAPSYVPELDLIVLSDSGEVAAFCTAWLDAGNGVAEFEPVGTVPDYRRHGLGAALLAEGSNRLRSMGCRRVIVNSGSEAVGANRLYAAAGFQAKDRISYWERRRFCVRDSQRISR